MTIIKTRKGEEILVDDEDYQYLNQFCWFTNNYGHTIFSRDNKIIGNFKTQKILMHRLIMNNTDSKIEIDHINHSRLDNSKCNLRVVTRQQNNFNRGLSKKSGFKGASWYQRDKK